MKLIFACDSGWDKNFQSHIVSDLKGAVNDFLEYLGEEYFMDLKFEVMTEEKDGSHCTPTLPL